MDTYFHLCDQAFFSEGGKLNAIGIFSELKVKVAYPTSFSPVFAAAQFHTPAKVPTVIDIKMKILGENGDPTLIFRYPTPTPPEKEYSRVAFNLPPIPLTKDGTYEFEILVNNATKATALIEVSHA